MRILNLPLWPRRKRQEDDASSNERDCTLRLFLSDAMCEVIVEGSDGELVTRISQHDAAPRANSQALLSSTICRLPPEIEDRVGAVEVFVDDPEVSVVDSRQAKLTHFEGRALSEFGKYQLGGKPISFASHVFGESSAHEAEKRLVAYIAEDHLSAVLFALGKLAKFTTFYGPWSLQSALGEVRNDTEARLAVHGHFSTLTLANGSAGALAVRHLPLGTSTLIQAYAEAHGLSFEDAAAALKSRPRLLLEPDKLIEPASPAAHVGTFQKLGPVLEQLKSEITATADYFEFQRLAGRAGSLSVHVTGNTVAGFGNWLAGLLDMQVDLPDRPDTSLRGKTAALNFLEGMRSGLLKLGSQLYDFSGGRFVPSQTAGSPVSNGKSASSPLMQKLRGLSAKPVTLEELRAFAPALCGVALVIAVIYSADTFWLSPLNNHLSVSETAYNATLARANANPAVAAPRQAEPVLWARDLMTIASVMPYDMKLTQVEMSSARPGTEPSLGLTGSLPRNGADNLQLIGKFMSRLSGSRPATRRFGDFVFAGAGDSAAAGASAANDPSQLMFRLNAKLAGGAQ